MLADVADPDPLLIDRSRRLPVVALVAILIVTVLGWWLIIQQGLLGIPLGGRPVPDALVWVLGPLLGLGGPLLLGLLELRVVVRAAEVVVHFGPFVVRRIDTATILGVEPVRYRPICGGGGWGVRWRPGGGWAYTLSGDRGVRLELTEGARVLIGAEDAQTLADAIERARERHANRTRPERGSDVPVP